MCLCACLCERDNMGGAAVCFQVCLWDTWSPLTLLVFVKKKKDANLAENFVCLNCDMAPSLRLD